MVKNKIEIDNKIYDLNYNVIRSGDTEFILSVSKEYNGEIIDKSMVKLAMINFESLVDVVEVMCRNTVTPTGFSEIVENMIIDRIFVE